LRSEERGDVDALHALVLAFRDHLAADTPSDADLRHHLPRALEDPGIEFYCAWLDDAAVGYTQIRFLTSIWTSSPEAHLEDLFVIAAARGRKLGQALLAHAVARARERGARRFSLNTNERNEVAQSLYRSQGMRPQTHALYPGGREVLWILELRA
jgi:ribosomal protein S18 acetylase RimI-like enzyme